VLNPTTAQFQNVTSDYVRDLTAIEPTITNSYELGYRGAISDRLGISVDAWTQRRENFVGPLIVETPNVFLDRATLTTYLIANLTPTVGAGTAAAIAPTIATGMAGVENATSVATTGVPLGVVNLNHPLNNPTDIVLAYRNFGTVDLHGVDLGANFSLTRGITLAGTYSWASKDLFPAKLGEHDIALNAPMGKGSISGRFRTAGNGLSAEVRNRWVKGFPANSGVYIGDVPSYSVLDAGVSFRPAMFNGAMLSVNATNLLDNDHIEFVGGAMIGRLILTRLQYSF
jgi:iron complex outermembrane receptor protein